MELAKTTRNILLLKISGSWSKSRNTGLAKDRIIKSAGYARAGIQDYWILNLKDRVLEVRRVSEEVHGEYMYKSVRTYTEAASVVPLAAPQTSVRVADLFPRKPKAGKEVCPPESYGEW